MSVAPDIASMIAGLGQGGPPQGAAPQQAPGPQEGADESRPLAILDQMIQLAKSYMNVEPDEEDKATMAKLLATLQQYKAKDQQDMQAAMGGNASNARIIRKAGTF